MTKFVSLCKEFLINFQAKQYCTKLCSVVPQDDVCTKCNFNCIEFV